MSRELVALAATAGAVAMSARTGQLGERARRHLLCDALAYGDRAWAAAVLAFEAQVDADPRGAGEALYAFAMGPGWPQKRYDWQDRADING